MDVRTLILTFSLFIAFVGSISSQNSVIEKDEKNHGVVWSVGLFKSWLKDYSVGFDKVGNVVIPVYDDKKKMGFAVQSHYMYRPTRWFGIGAHLGLGLDVNSYIESPVVLFGPSISLGNNNQFIIDFGWADGKRKIVPGTLRNQLDNTVYTDIPELHNHTELNTNYYLGISYKIH